MSSFLGHSIAAATIYVAAKPPAKRVLWAAWLVVVASAPDVDYLIPAWRLSGPTTLRITHSILGCLVVPALTCVALLLAGLKGRELVTRGLQVCAAGLSHLVLDLLVGVTPAALLWPFSSNTYRLPIGLLPSAGRLKWANGLLLRNTLIELGVLVPIFLIVWRRRTMRWPSKITWLILTGGCMFIAFSLKRP